MKDLFVPYEIALKLKEKGFDESCLRCYDNGKLMEFRDFRTIAFTAGEVQPENLTGGLVAAPLYQQVTDWFREKHGIIISVTNKFNHQPKEWIGVVSRMDDYYMEETTKVVPTYYKALTEAIETTIKLV